MTKATVSDWLITILVGLVVILFFVWAAHAATKPLSLYKNTGTFILYIDPADPDMTREAWVLQDHTQVETSGPLDGSADPLHDLYAQDQKWGEFYSGPNGFKIHTVGKFPYRDSDDGNSNPTICVPVKIEPHITAEACYSAFPRDPSILDAPQRKGVNKDTEAEIVGNPIEVALPKDTTKTTFQESKERPSIRLTFLEKFVFSVCAISGVGILAVVGLSITSLFKPRYRKYAKKAS